MFQLALVAMTALQASTITLPSAPSSAAATRAAVVAEPIVSSPEHIARARLALANGEFDIARREFVTAAAIDRDEGKLPAEASFGLAHVLYAQSYNREAAMVLERLAADASTAGDVDTEAKALLDAMWLNVDAKQRLQARADASRLRVLLRDKRLSNETRKLVASRVN
ncbi:hypothetical protein [Gemmatimonas groenlandica]|uniref:Tetratricopeptide repeat protein n=1 Tax=Gemmatimonas groenlandica TaxID=2732249 RepID=A0A6M4IM69_9BACT|nr:hypothetical protein [Gemmatimonas groenlandica]QJR34112.1 hypothetical protein HKW67_00580 [Gemmatimonas groenlandica]